MIPKCKNTQKMELRLFCTMPSKSWIVSVFLFKIKDITTHFSQFFIPGTSHLSSFSQETGHSHFDINSEDLSCLYDKLHTSFAVNTKIAKPFSQSLSFSILTALQMSTSVTYRNLILQMDKTVENHWTCSTFVKFRRAVRKQLTKISSTAKLSKWQITWYV